jgi:hypothetical protein
MDNFGSIPFFKNAFIFQQILNKLKNLSNKDTGACFTNLMLTLCALKTSLIHLGLATNISYALCATKYSVFIVVYVFCSSYFPLHCQNLLLTLSMYCKQVPDLDI